MPTFAYFNYQFGKVLKLDPTFDDQNQVEEANTAFARRQEILDEILMRDYETMREDDTKCALRMKGRKKKEHHYRFLTQPKDNIYILEIQNSHCRMDRMEDFGSEMHTVYPTCLVVIDNRYDIQRLIIECNREAFTKPKQVRELLEKAMNRLLKPYRLSWHIDPLFTSNVFWNVALDTVRYPNGFAWIEFYLPHLNLERLKHNMAYFLNVARESYQSDLTWRQKAVPGGSLQLDPNDQRQNALINYMTEELGGDRPIVLKPRGAGQKKVVIGGSGNLTHDIDSEVFDKLKRGGEDAAEALDQLKIDTKWHIAQ